MSSYREQLQIEVKWVSGLCFEATNRSGLRQQLDGDIECGLSPMQGLLASLGTAVGGSVALLLERVSSELRGLNLSVRGERHQEPPQYLRRLELEFHVEGAVSKESVEQAVQTVLKRYCGVLHSLREDVEIDFLVKVSS